jgi:hypothetical protein
MTMQHITLSTLCIAFILVSHMCMFVTGRAEQGPEETPEPAQVECVNPSKTKASLSASNHHSWAFVILSILIMIFGCALVFMDPVSLVICHQPRVALPPLLQWLARERNWIRTHGSTSRRAVDCIGNLFSRKCLCPSLLTMMQNVAICGPCKIRMVLEHTWTERGKHVACWSIFPCRVYIDSNHRDSRIWVTGCLWQ